MRQKLMLLCLLLVPGTMLLAQRKIAIVHVDANHKINGEPYVKLPKAAVKLNLSLVEFTYAAGKNLTRLISNVDYSKPDDSLKSDLAILDSLYGINPGVLVKLLRQKHSTGKDDTVVYKLDKDIKTTVMSIADYNKIFKYTGIKKKALNSNLLNLQYNDDGVLISSKQTSESKVLPTILSAVSGLISIATAAKSMGPQLEARGAQQMKYLTINWTAAKSLNTAISNYNTMLSDALYNKEQFEARNKNSEANVTKLFEDLFYSREIKTIPLEVNFIIPGGTTDAPTAGADKTFDLFYYRSSDQVIVLNSSLQPYLHATPQNRFIFGTVTNPVRLRLSSVEAAYDNAAGMGGLMAADPAKKTAVYNIPKKERMRLENPASPNAYFDSTIKVPQHGPLGYFSMRLSTLELTYDANGELKTFAGENKSNESDGINSVTKTVVDGVTLLKGESEIDRLKKRAELLETEKKIRDLENSSQ